ncbi:hyaluronidase PH-20-like [Cololabis saira]|uniref:hyaluronidase PH-20-like n=1 Tax=Cololabis saira TaxID=129043 RepID=UPI002AD56D15|nr:hyaluronidase PH-20-like [Cololabis saira]
MLIKMSPVKLAQRFCSTLVPVLALLSVSVSLPMADPPMVPGRPFMFMWNAPTELCEVRYDIDLDLSYFDLESSTLKSATNQSISLFYTDRFGVFPYVNEDTGEMHEDGLPQFIDMAEHREEAEDDIEYYIPTDQPGLAVLDFEEWRPQWNRNWGDKDIYRDISVDMVKFKNPTMSDDMAEDRAKIVFERAAKKYFVKSINIGKRLRPNRRWGYYLYPDCYNYDFNQGLEDFTGECPDIEKDRNDELLWLWKESTALYPSIYLELMLRDTQQARWFVRHRMQEAMRVSALANSSHAIPVYPYIRPVYKDSVDNYMSEYDLVNTIGEAASLGAAGVVAWGDMDLTDTEESCIDADNHLDQVMNPYILNVSMATKMCSKALCQGQGRCVRKNWNEDVYLHLDPRRYRIQRDVPGGPLTVNGRLSQDDIRFYDQNFDCMCYSPEPCRSVLSLSAITEPVTNTSQDGNKQRLRKKIAVAKKAFEEAVTEYNAVVGEAEKLPLPNDFLTENNDYRQSECHGDMAQKKEFYFNVMELTSLKEEAVVLIREFKQYWEQMKNMTKVTKELFSQLSQGLPG